MAEAMSVVAPYRIRLLNGDQTIVPPC